MRKANPNEEWKEICRIEHENDDNLEKEYEVKGLEPGEEYEFGVCEVNIVGDGPFSDSIPIKTGLKEFRFERNDDQNGLIYWLGTNKGTSQDFQNPVDLGFVSVSSSGEYNSSCSMKNAVGRDNTKGYASGTKANCWILIDLKNHSIIPKHYSFLTPKKWSAPIHWKFEGSDDGGKTWALLKQHNNDQSVVQGGGTSASWKIEGVEKAFSQFRLTQTGKDSAGYYRLQISRFEIYGILMRMPT